MDKLKRSRCGDRLSELPDSLIFEIFWLLPIRDVIRTTKLSRRWKDLWITSPFLNFTDYGYKIEGTLEKDRNFYNRALILWRGVKLLKFKVIFSSKLSTSLAGDINVWVRLAMGKGVKELYLDLHYRNGVDDDTEAEFECLYSCSSLEVLSIKGCPFLYDYDDDDDWNVNVKWDRLKSLTLFINSLGQDLLSKVLCGSPNLEVLILDHYVGDEGGNWCIQSTSLKELYIIKNSMSDMYEEKTEMKIQTPNLETLQIIGGPYTKFSMDVARLTELGLDLYCMDECCGCGEIENNEFPGTKGMLEQILPITQHVETLTLWECCLEVLGVMNKKSLLSPFSKVKLLKLNTSPIHPRSFSKHLQIAGLLQNFPKLKRLVIQDEFENELLLEDENEDDYQDDQESLEFEANLPISFLLQLRTVEVTWAKCDGSIFSFIKTLLKYASKLEKMVFRERELKPPSGPSRSLFIASQKLLRMPRSSPTAQLIFCKY